MSQKYRDVFRMITSFSVLEGVPKNVVRVQAKFNANRDSSQEIEQGVHSHLLGHKLFASLFCSSLLLCTFVNYKDKHVALFQRERDCIWPRGSRKLKQEVA